MPELPRRLRAPGLALAAIVALVGGAGCPERQPGPPRLGLLVVIDQLRADRLDPALPGGLGRLAREGRVFLDAAVAHADTETCPGHVAASTGRHPGPVGIPGNQFVDRASGRVVYCVADPAPDALVHGAGQGRSPRSISASSVGDWLKQSRPEARVFSLSAKDRAAISLGGQRPDAAYWLERREALGFTTSRYYRADLPDWVRRFNGEGGDGGFVSRLPATWEHEGGSPANGARGDDYAWETDRFSRTSPHPLGDGDRRTALARLFFSPQLDEVTLDFARALVENEGLGQGEGPDLLTLSLSATDLVGHFYGPWSQEARDALLRVDAALGRFLDFLEGRLGRGAVVVALTADHGVLPIPEWLIDTGRSQCPVRRGRVYEAGLVAALESDLEGAFGPAGAEKGPWLHRAGYSFTVNRARAGAAGVTPERVVERARVMLEAQPVVERVWTVADITGGEGPEPFASLYRNSYHPERSGDFAVQPAGDCLISLYPLGTSHGTPYLYDRAVPLVFFGPGVEPGRARGGARLVDVAPTLAGLLGVTPPSGLDGRALPLR